MGNKTVKYFTASWCPPCKMFKPIMKEIEREGYSIQFIDIDHDENDLTEKYNIQSVPTSIIEEDGKEVERFVGTLSKKEVLEKLV
jgi:thioredoxin 1